MSREKPLPSAGCQSILVWAFSPHCLSVHAYSVSGLPQAECPVSFPRAKRRYASFDKVISLCADAGFSPRIAATSSASTGMIALVAAGEGVALLPQDSAVLRGNELMLVPLADRMASVDLVIAWAPEHENPVLHSFLDVALKKRRKP